MFFKPKGLVQTGVYSFHGCTLLAGSLPFVAGPRHWGEDQPVFLQGNAHSSGCTALIHSLTLQPIMPGRTAILQGFPVLFTPLKAISRRLYASDKMKLIANHETTFSHRVLSRLVPGTFSCQSRDRCRGAHRAFGAFLLRPFFAPGQTSLSPCFRVLTKGGTILSA